MFTQKTFLSRVLTVLILVGVCHLAIAIGIPTAYAQIPPPSAQDVKKDEIIDIVSKLTTILQFALFMCLNFLEYLLQADYFNDGLMMRALNNIWVLSRNIMNVLFALMLIGVAFYTIITAKSEMIKNKFSQFLVAVILVNFSWFFPRVIIDIANVLTSTIYSVPGMLPFATCIQFDGQPCKVIVSSKLLPNDAGDIANWRAANNCGAPVADTCPCEGPELYCYKLADYNATIGTRGLAHTMINGMAVSFVKFQTLPKLPDDFAIGAGGGGTMRQFKDDLHIMMNIMTTLLVQVTMILPLVGLTVGLFIRIVILWITMAFMPFSFFGYVINGKLGTNVFGFEIDLWSEFIAAAFLPAMVAIPMVIGFIMLETVAKIPAPAGFPQDIGITLITGQGSWWGILWMFGALAIIWIGSFAALRRSKITGRITDKIKGFGDQIIGGVVKLPLLTPLPVGVGGKDKLGNDISGGKNFGTLFSDARNFGNNIGAKTGVSGTPGNGGLGGLQNLFNPKNGTEDENTRKIVEAINNMASNDVAKQNQGRDELRRRSGTNENGQTILRDINLILNDNSNKLPSNVRDKIKASDIAKAIENAKKNNL